MEHFDVNSLDLRKEKTRGKISSSPDIAIRWLLENGRNVIGVISFISLAEVALAAELSG